MDYYQPLTQCSMRHLMPLTIPKSQSFSRFPPFLSDSGPPRLPVATSLPSLGFCSAPGLRLCCVHPLFHMPPWVNLPATSTPMIPCLSMMPKSKPPSTLILDFSLESTAGPPNSTPHHQTRLLPSPISMNIAIHRASQTGTIVILQHSC